MSRASRDFLDGILGLQVVDTIGYQKTASCCDPQVDQMFGNWCSKIQIQVFQERPGLASPSRHARTVDVIVEEGQPRDHRQGSELDGKVCLEQKGQEIPWVYGAKLEIGCGIDKGMGWVEDLAEWAEQE